MSRLFKKALYDLFGNHTRLFTALMAIILGTTVFGSVTFVYTLLNREIRQVFTDTTPASGMITVNKIDDKFLELTNGFSGFTDFEVKAQHKMRIEKSDGSLKTLWMFSANDLATMRMNKLKLVDGSFTPEDGETLIERDALGVAGAKMGDELSIQLPDSSVSKFRITGAVNDLSQHPPSMHNEVYVYLPAKTLSELGLPMNRIDYFVSGDVYDRDNILQVTSEYIKLLEQNGYHVAGVTISDTPGISMHLREYQGALFIFQAFSILAFLFGCVIMSSLLTTVLAGQVRQIGILKSIGAKTTGIMAAYMGAALLLVAINMVISLPLSILVSRFLSEFFMGLGNMQMSSFALPTYLYIVFVSASLLVPVALAYLPIRRGLSITVKDALNDYGIQANAAKKAVNLPKAISKKLSRPVLLSLRSAMEHKRRFLMNVVMLTLGGLVFVGVMATWVSVNTALSKNLDSRRYDYVTNTSSYQDSDKIDTALTNLTTVTGYEKWGSAAGKLVYTDGYIGNLYSITAPEHNTKLFSPEIMDGRWLWEGDTNEIVVSFEFFNPERSYALGDTVSFRFGNQIEDFTIVGTVKEVGPASIYMNRSGFEQIIPLAAQKSSLRISTISESNRGKLNEMHHEIEESLTEADVSVVSASTKAEQYKILTDHFAATLMSFLIVAIMAVCVGGLGLASTMSVQVAERTREIGIMKSMGAGVKQIRSIVSAESTFICLLSWGISLILSVPAMGAAIYVIGVHVLEIPLAISPLGIAISLSAWLVMTLLVGRFASRGAAKRASKMSVKTALAFD